MTDNPHTYREDELERFEPIARRIFDAAIAERRCGELLLSLFDGAGVTVNHKTGRLVIAWPPTVERADRGNL